MGQSCTSAQSHEIPRGRKRKKLLDEEKAMLHQESALGFEKLMARQVFMSLRAYSGGNAMNDAQLTQAAGQLGIIAPLGGTESNLGAFYNTFKIEGGYSVSKLVTLGIMLSKGQPADKAKLYFDCFDMELTGMLPREKFIVLAETMVAIAIDSIPLLTTDQGKFSISKDRINNYIFNLKKKRKTSVDRLADDFYSGKTGPLSQAEFVERFTKKDNMDYSKLSTAYGTRVYLNWIFANTPDEVYSKGASVFAALLNKAKATTPPAAEAAPGETTNSQT